MAILNTRFSSVIRTEEGLVFFERHYNSLWSCDCNFENVRWLRALSMDVEVDDFMAFNLFEYDNSYFISSQTGRVIVEYDKDKNRFISYKMEIYDDEEGCLFNTLQNGEFLIIIPTELNRPVGIFNMNLRIYEGSTDVTIGKDGDRAGYLFIEGDEIYIPSIGKNYVYKYNKMTNKVQLIDLPEHVQASGVGVCEDSIYVSTQDSKSLWRRDRDGFHEVILGTNMKECAFSNIVVVDDRLILLPRNQTKLYIYNRVSDEVEIYDIPIDNNGLEFGGASLFFGHYINDDKIFFLPWTLPEIWVFDLKRNSLSSFGIECVLNNYLMQIAGIMQENEPYTLQDMITGISI